MSTLTLAGEWKLEEPVDLRRTILLPGTLDTNGIGYADFERSADYCCLQNEPISCRLTRKHTYEGTAIMSRRLNVKPPYNKRIFFEVERARQLSVNINNQIISPYRPQTLVTPHIFELTDHLTGDDNLMVESENAYRNMPHDAIIKSSMATDHTQTNWNGLLGYLRLRIEEETFIDRIRVYPSKKSLTVKVDIDSRFGFEGRIRLTSTVLVKPVEQEISLNSGYRVITFEDLTLSSGIRRWDEYDGFLYDLTVEVLQGTGPRVETQSTVQFGIRDFGADSNGRLALNGRPFFLRGETNCAEFPETGYSPTELSDWMRILELYHSYGINIVRFHSHCPPEAAFEAADRLGMMMQPELSHWDCTHAFESDVSYTYYRTELEQTIDFLANHPSFVMLTLGNELSAGQLGHERMSSLLEVAHDIDSTRLYANSSNPFYGKLGNDSCNDVYTSASYKNQDMRCCFENVSGSINASYPGSMHSFKSAMKAYRRNNKVPVFGFEVGQYEVLPDFREIDEFAGVTRPDNYSLVQERAEKAGIDQNTWDAYVSATGELSRLCYREEVESVLRTPEMSGLSLLGLQDFPGQGTALVGMMDAHLQPKRFSFAQPERFRSFFAPQLPLLLLERYTYTSNQTLKGQVCVANYGRSVLEGDLHLHLRAGQTNFRKVIPKVRCPVGKLTVVGQFRFPLNFVARNLRCELNVEIDGATNSYPIWIYFDQPITRPVSIHESRFFDDEAKRILSDGGTVYLSPDSSVEALPQSVQAHFSPDFWSVGTFSAQSGTMGQFIDKSHPLFDNFPTEEFTDWQWWPMAKQRAIILPKRYASIITEMDSYAYLRSMTQLLECRCGRGRLFLSSLGLQNLLQYPEARALEMCIYQYLDSAQFKPSQYIDDRIISNLVAER